MFAAARRSLKAVAALTVAGAALGVAGTPAQASNVYIGDGRDRATTLFIDGGDNPADITISMGYMYELNWFTVRDTGPDGARNPFFQRYSDDCIPIDRQTVRCYGQRLGVRQIIVRTGRGNDRVLINKDARSQLTRAEIWGGAGNDTLIAQGSSRGTGGSAPIFLLGGDGNDVLVGSHNQEALWGGPGNDRIAPGVVYQPYGVDVLRDDIDGGHGDFLPYSGEPVIRDYSQSTRASCVARTHGFYDRYDDSGSGAEGVDTLDLQAPDADGATAEAGMLADLNVCRLGSFLTSSVSLVYGIENVKGTDLNDRLVGDDTDNLLRPAAGNDWVSGEGGHDYIDTVDGGVDTVKCSSGADTYQFDSVDTPLNCPNNQIR